MAKQSLSSFFVFMVFAVALSIIAIALVSCDQSQGFSKEAVAKYTAINSKRIRPLKEENIKSNMHDLRLSWINISEWDATGGALAEIDDLLFIIKPTGELVWIDLAKLNGPYMTGVQAPMNRSKLISTGFSNRINLGWFRVAGAYVEPTTSGVRLFVVHHVFRGRCFFLQVSSVDLLFDAKAGIKQERDWRRVFRPNPCIRIGDASKKPFAGHQAGGRIISLDRNHVLVSYGDHEIEGRGDSSNSPQDPKLPYGKLWKIAKDGSSSEVYAVGVKNPQGLFLDNEDGNIWETEHGPQGGDELNLIKAGKNYGWPSQTYGVGYAEQEWPLNSSQGRHSSDKYEVPIFAWVPSIGTSNLTKIKGPKFPLWAGDILLATLRDHSIRRLRIIEERVVYDERIDLGTRLRDIIALEDGGIAVLSDGGAVGLINDPGPKLKK